MQGLICAGTSQLRIRHLRNPIRHLILADPPPHAPMQDVLLIYSVHIFNEKSSIMNALATHLHL